MSAIPTPNVRIAIIVALAENGVIGFRGKMPWHIPSELKYFKSRTLGKPVIMGRKTFQSIGKPLPGRTNIVITRDANFKAEGVVIVGSLVAAVDEARRVAEATDAGEIMVIGGGEIFAQALPMAERVYLTRVAARPEGDATFSELPPEDWREVERLHLPLGPKDQFGAAALVYDRIRA